MLRFRAKVLCSYTLAPWFTDFEKNHRNFVYSSSSTSDLNKSAAWLHLVNKTLLAITL
jgi:hypothetical protein